MNSIEALPDLAERLAAVATDRSAIVQAPAGSGKTTLLVQRFLNLLSVVEKPEEILAITFTRKAAAEMQARVVAALNEDNDQSRAIRARSVAKGWHLEALPARLRIQTIDAFCVGLLQRLPVSSGIGDRLHIVEDAESFYREAVDRTFERLHYDFELNPELAALLAHFDNDFDEARRSLSAMLAKRDQWLEVVALTLRTSRTNPQDGEPREPEFVQAIEAGIRALHANAIADIEADLGEIQLAELAAVAGDAARRMNIDWPSTGLPTDLAQWRFIAELLTTRDGRPRVRLGSAQGFSDSARANQSAKARLRALIDDLDQRDLIVRLASLRLLPTPTLESAEVEAIVNLATGLALAAAELGNIFRRNGVIDFAELNFAAQRALGDADSPSDLALALDYRIKHLLIDEFQDTSAIQYRLVECLIREWPSDDTRSLFVVGDPMQSIYRFRDADVALFQRARRNGISALRPTAFRISANFRSSASLVEWCNSIFAESFGTAEDPVLGQVAFAQSTSVHPARHGEGCRVYGIQSPDPDRAEAVAVVQTIESIEREHPGESIAILVRNRTHLRHVLHVLSARRIPWTGSDIRALADQPVIVDLMTLLKALSSSTDRIAWLALLRTPFVGVSLRDIESLSQFKETIAALVRSGARDDVLSDDALARLLRIRAILLQAERTRRQMPIRQWLENTFIRLGGADAYEDEAIAHAQRLFALIENTQERTLDIAALERSVQRLFAEATPRANSVAVMTIHRAKGLEFDHVIVPGLHRVSRIDDPPPILWRSESGRLLLGVRGTRNGDSVHRWLSHEERHRDANERTRLLYVAATRARRTLHLFGALEDIDGEPKPPPARSLFAPIWRAARESIELVRDAERATDSSPAPSDRPLRRVLPADYIWRPRARTPDRSM